MRRLGPPLAKREGQRGAQDLSTLPQSEYLGKPGLYTARPPLAKPEGERGTHDLFARPL